MFALDAAVQQLHLSPILSSTIGQPTSQGLWTDSKFLLFIIKPIIIRKMSAIVKILLQDPFPYVLGSILSRFLDTQVSLAPTQYPCTSVSIGHTFGFPISGRPM